MTVTENERRLLELCQRLLQHNEQLHAELEYLQRLLECLCAAYRSLQSRYDGLRDAHAVENEATDVLFGAAMDLLNEQSQLRGE